AGALIAGVLESGEPVVSPDVLVLPLTGRRGCVGVLALLATNPERVFGEDDLALAVEFGRRIASSVENAVVLRDADRAMQERDRLLASERAARASAEQS